MTKPDHFKVLVFFLAAIYLVNFVSVSRRAIPRDEEGNRLTLRQELDKSKEEFYNLKHDLKSADREKVDLKRRLRFLRAEVEYLKGPTKKKKVKKHYVTKPKPKVASDSALQYLTDGENYYYEKAKKLEPLLDKVKQHSYQIMYGKFLLPYYNRNPSMKMLEIRKGCKNMGDGAGASKVLYDKLFPEANFWEAIHDSACTDNLVQTGRFRGVNVLHGDQMNDEILDSWITTSGGDFDVVIDDGGHQNCQIWHSFLKLWPQVKPGGLYFIEGLHVSRLEEYRRKQTATCNSSLVVTDEMKDFLEDLMYGTQKATQDGSDIKFLYCQSQACVLGKKESNTTLPKLPVPKNFTEIATQYLRDGEVLYAQTATSLGSIPDKVTSHSYQTMYGTFLLPYYHQKPNMKMLEIGLGCTMDSGPGPSVGLYKKLLPEAELWEAEQDTSCVEKHMTTGKLEGVNVVTGDQQDDAVLDGWIEKSGGNFDVVIDDGGHQNCQIWHTFLKLWPQVKPGGLYFFEDLQLSTGVDYGEKNTATCDSSLSVKDKLQHFLDDLMYIKQKSYRSEYNSTHIALQDRDFRNVNFLFCQAESCVLGKKEHKLAKWKIALQNSMNATNTTNATNATMTDSVATV